jgi:hypothetical protein
MTTGVIFEQPSPLFAVADTPVFYQRRPVGTVTGLTLDGDLLRWTGRLDSPTLTLHAASPVAVPVPVLGPVLSELIAARRLVGVADLVQGEMSTRAGSTVVSRWSVAGVSLISSRPWPEIELYLCEQTPSAASA